MSQCPKGSNEPKKEWKWKLESLQSQHKKEIIQQQQEHLEQLRLMQGLLLQEIAVNISMNGTQVLAEVTSEGKRGNSPSSSSERSEEEVNKSTTFVLNKPNPWECESTDSEDMKEEGKIVSSPRYSTTSGLHPPSPKSVPSKVLTKRELTLNTSQDKGGGLPTPSQITKDLSKSSEPADVEVVPLSTGDLESVMNVATSTNQSTACPSTPPLTPKRAWSSPTHHPSHLLPPSPLSIASQTSSLGGYRPSQSISLDHSELRDSFTMRSVEESRAALLKRHAKQMNDLKQYYESEIKSLVDKLRETRQGYDSTLSSPVRRSLDFGSKQGTPTKSSPNILNPSRNVIAGKSLREVVEDTSLAKMLKSENLKLETECSRLHQLLEDTNRQCHILIDQEKRAQNHALEWQRRCESSEKIIEVLQDRLESARRQLQDQDVLKEQLQTELKIVAEELQIIRTQREQDLEKIDKLYHEFQILQLENDELNEKNNSHKAELDKSDLELASLRAAAEKHEMIEAHYKSTIQCLEDERRHLEHVRNRLHSMGTHYELGTYNSQSEWHGSKSPSSKHHRSPEHSPYQIRSPSTGGPVQDKDQPPIEVTPVARHLTRKKWLEPSDPGLFGSTPTKPNTGEQSRDVPSSSVSKSPARVPSEDRFPGIKVTYSPRKRGKNEVGASLKKDLDSAQVDELANSVLKAIKEGRITAGPMERGKKVVEVNVDDRVKRHLEVVTEAEQKLVQLQSEKEKLQSALQRTPKAGGRVDRVSKQMQLDKERRLEEVVQEIGSVRMILRKHHALRK